jgi:hypothetical protein
MRKILSAGLRLGEGDIVRHSLVAEMLAVL